MKSQLLQTRTKDLLMNEVNCVLDHGHDRDSGFL